MMALEEKLNLWVKLTGVDPSIEEKSIVFRMDGKLSRWDIEQMNERIKEALSFDKSGMFADAYLGVYFDQFIKDQEMTLDKLLTDPEVESYLRDTRTLYQTLKESDSANIIMADARKAMNFYGLSSDDLTVFDIVETRTSAERCMNGKLRTLQFSSGDPSESGFKMTQDIYMYRNLDAMLLCAANNTIDGVSLGYVRDDKNVTQSYFAFIIKNGQNLYLLTDKPKLEYPGQDRNSRCPGRDMSRRIENNMFPYDSVAQIDTSDLWNSGRYGTAEYDDSNKNALAEAEVPRIKIGTFSNMSENEAFWAVMMIAEIKKKFYEKVPQFEISYTGSMIVNHQIENKNEKTALIIRNELPSMELTDISLADTEDFGCSHEYGKCQYIIDRYKDQVDPDISNMIEGSKRYEIADEKYSSKNCFGDRIPSSIVAFDLNEACGTKEEILRDQRWIERKNYATQIKKLADKDYEENKRNIKEEVGKMITPRIREICRMHLRGDLAYERATEKAFPKEEVKVEQVNYSNQYDFDKWYVGCYSTGLSTGLYRYGMGRGGRKAEMRCAFTGAKAGVVIEVEPRTADQLAKLCGCNVSDLPEQIQHYGEDKGYDGNCLLNRLDPLSYMINDPFQKMSFKITILLSKKEYLVLCEESGVEKNKFWQTEKPVCFTLSMADPEKEKCRGNYSYKMGRKHFAKKCFTCRYFDTTKLKE